MDDRCISLVMENKIDSASVLRPGRDESRQQLVGKNGWRERECRNRFLTLGSI